MAIAFERWSELMAQSLRHDRPLHRNQFLPSEKSSDESSIESAGPKILRVTPRTTGAIFESGARWYEERAARGLVPEEAREEKPTRIFRQKCPPAFIHVDSAL